MVENPMVLHQEKYDAQMQPYLMARCDYCGELIEKHNTTVFDGNYRVCCECETQYLWDCAQQDNFDDFCLLRPVDYLVKWWFANLSDTEKVAVLWGSYTNRLLVDKMERGDRLVKDHQAYCEAHADEFLQYMREVLQCGE